MEAMCEPVAFLILAARDACGADEERRDLLAQPLGAGWEEAYARGSTSGDVITRLSFALAREIEEKLFDMTPSGPKGDR